MGYRLAFQLFIISLPFLVFGIYLLLIADAEQDGRRKWPIQTLFTVGFVLSALVWLIAVLLEDRSNSCHQPAVFEDGKVVTIPSEDCERETAPFNE